MSNTRDQLATAAMRAIMRGRGAELLALAADPVEWPRVCVEVALGAYAAADAMLAADDTPDGKAGVS
jgi:hypothetical protein